MSYVSLDKYTKIQVLFYLIKSISMLMTLFQYFTSETLITSKKLMEPFFTI